MMFPSNNLASGLGALFSVLSFLRVIDGSLTSEEVIKKFEEAGIVPDMIPVAPRHPMEVLFKNKTVKYGNEFTRGDFETMPTNIQWETEPDRWYTLIFTDIDCPKRSLPIDKEWNHYLVVNIPGCDVVNGEVLAGYIGALPYYLQFPHRYVFLAYLQPEKTPTVFDEPRLDHRPIESERAHFSTNDFAEKYNLGVPVAGNFFMAGGPEPTDELPWVLKQLLTTDAPKGKGRKKKKD